MAKRKSHDQNFKNLILDYPREALAFFAAEEADDLLPSVKVTPIRQEQFFSSQNIVARLNHVRWAEQDKIEVYAKAIQGLFALESSVEKQLKYIDFVDIYSDLNEDERQGYQRRYPQEESKMAGLAERRRSKGGRV
ncbi:hypothetical protein [Vreelandella olivaria]|uniref:hypothetical protein n=1 Tax=Vreelandella olivaria TaxID=390919 RepID=UPI00201EE394|nr:hypothetical protein [Halomonas olivaria]